ncbi:hypothetical protein Tco_0116652 [Tanacetum coccineum]
MSMRVLLAKERILKLIQDWDEKQIKPWSLPEFLLQLSNDSRTINEMFKQRKEKRIERNQAANMYTIQFKEYLENSSKAITPDLPIEEPDNSLSMGDDHLSTIPETESDEVIKSRVENLVPIPSESKGTSDDTCDVPFCDNSPPLDVLNDHFEIFSDSNDDCTSSDNDSFENIDYVEASPPDSELVSLEEVKDDLLREELLNINLLIACDLPSSDDFSPISIFEEKSVTFSNPLFNSNDDFTSSDDESLSDEDVPEDRTSSARILVTPLSNSNEVECLAPSDDIEIILHHDSSISVVSILEGFTDEPPLEENDDLFDLESKANYWKKIFFSYICELTL